MQIKNNLVNILMFMYLAFFSLPLIFLWYYPLWQFTSYDYDPFATFLRLLCLLFSPWALLIMGTICYKKGLKLQTYLATTLFIWSIIMQVSLVLFTQILQMPRWPYMLFPWIPLCPLLWSITTCTQQNPSLFLWTLQNVCEFEIEKIIAEPKN